MEFIYSWLRPAAWAGGTGLPQRDGAVSKKRSAVVIGGGLLGVTTGYYLSSNGYDVTIIDAKLPGEGVGEESLICPCAPTPWRFSDDPPNFLSPLLLLWDSLTSRTAPTTVSLDALLDWRRLFRWGSMYWRCSRDRDHALEAMRWRSVLGKHGVACYRKLIHSNPLLASCNFASGTIVTYDSIGALSSAFNKLERARECGLETKACRGADEVVQLEPFLDSCKASTRFEGAVCIMDSMTGNRRNFVNSMCEALAVTPSVTFVSDDPVIEIRPAPPASSPQAVTSISGVVSESGRVYTADVYVIASSEAALRLCPQMGVELPLYQILGYSMSFPWKGPKDRQLFSSIVDGERGVSITPTGPGSVRVSGFADFKGPLFDLDKHKETHAGRLEGLLAVASTYFEEHLQIPTTIDDESVVWEVVKFSATPDDLPIIGKLTENCGNLFINVGHGPHSFSTSCGAADVLARLISESTCSPSAAVGRGATGGNNDCLPEQIDPACFSLARFSAHHHAESIAK